MDKDKFIELIGKKLTKSLIPKEEEAFNSLLDDSNNKTIYRKFENLWKGSREEYSALNSKRAFNRVLIQIQKEELEYINSEGENNRYKLKIGIRRIAAIITFFIVVSFGVYWYINLNPTEINEIHAREIIKNNPRGQKSTVFLPDGSNVILNSESSITYSSIFDNDKREVRISGEAYFEVDHDNDRPFIVKTDYMDIRVLGTSFNVNAFKNTNGIKVSLVTGKVEVYENGKDLDSINKIILSPRQAISYNINKSSFDKITRFNPEAEYGWKDGLIYFEKASFDEIISRLSNWYGVDFIIHGKPKKEWIYSGKFDNYALSNVLHALSFTGKFNYELEGKKVEIKF
ncbi:MAG: FecR family protein [Cyclobacteriaceae bacterium]|nr:FecR family protein [Cyclobacteriaceae bacterium]